MTVLATFALNEVKARDFLAAKLGAELRKTALSAAIRNNGDTPLAYDTVLDGHVEVSGGSIPSRIEAVIGTSGELYVLKKGLAALYDTNAFDEASAIVEAGTRGIALTSKEAVDAAIAMLRKKNGENALVDFLGWFSSKGHIQAFRFPEGTSEVKMWKESWGSDQVIKGEGTIVFNLLTQESYMIDRKAIKAEWYSVNDPALKGEALIDSIPVLTADDMFAMAV